jgi:hypothetical protein
MVFMGLCTEFRLEPIPPRRKTCGRADLLRFDWVSSVVDARHVCQSLSDHDVNRPIREPSSFTRRTLAFVIDNL